MPFLQNFRIEFVFVCVRCLTLVGMFGMPLLHAQSTWSQFRGDEANGVAADNAGLPLTWSETDNVKWVAEVPGWGWSSPVVWGDRVYLTSVIADSENLTPSKGLYLGRGVRDPAKGTHHWMVYCFDLNTGTKVWEHEAHAGEPKVPRHPKSTYAAETAATDGTQVYVVFGDLGLFCYDMDGKPKWSRRFQPRKTFMDYGAAASPVVHDGQVFVVYDNLEDSWVAAYDCANGQEKWRRKRDETHSWATPFVWKNSLRDELVVPGKRRNRSYSMKGELLWEFDGQMSNLVIPSPFEAHGMCYIASGYIGDAHRPTFAVLPGAKGNIAKSGDFADSEFIRWYQPTASSYNPTQIVYGDYLYTLYDQGFLTCHDAKTGKKVYGKKRFSPAGSFTASPVAYNGHLFCLSEDGLTYVVKAGESFELVAKNELQELALACPAVVGEKLLIRTASRLYCLTDGAKLSAEVQDSLGAKRGNGARQQKLTLPIAASRGDQKQVIRLLGTGADIDGRDGESGNTALCMAAVYGRDQMTRFLLEKGADPNVSNRDGNCPLLIAAFFCREQQVKLLLEAGAQKESANGNGDTALSVVSGPWNQSREETYKLIGRAVNLDLDLQRIRQARSRVLEMLKNHPAKK